MTKRTAPVSAPTLSPELVKAIDHLTATQRPAGCVVGEVVWCPIITAQYVLVAYMTHREIPPARRARFLRYFRAWQTADGGWGMHAESPAYVFVTTLVYVALRLLGVGPDDDSCRRARAWLAGHGGAEQIPSWGKLWLAMMNLYGWDGVNPVPPELWCLPTWLPVHPRRLYCHTRLIYLGFCYLYGVRFQTAVTGLIENLRAELYTQPYAAIDFRACRDLLAPTDVYVWPSRLARWLHRLSAAYERIHRRSVRQRALRLVLDMIVSHQRESNFAAISPVNGLLNTLALYQAGHPDFEPSFRGVDYWAWEDEREGERFNGAHSHTWDTAFLVQALCEGPAADRCRSFLRGAARYLERAQVREEVASLERRYRDPRRGGFCFSDERHRWPVSDCTGEALSAIGHLFDRVEPEERVEPPALLDAVRFVLSRQNRDGGWGSYERRRGGLLLERVNPSEMFGNCMVEHSYVECTGSCLGGLRHALDRFPDALSPRDRRAVGRALRRGARFLRRRQQPEGSWPGFWGINYTYGTLFGTIGLLASGARHDDPAILRASRWLVGARLADGGWGESWRSCVEGRPIPHERSQVIMTSWALIALLKARYDGPGARAAITDGIRLLRDRQLPDGDWPKEAVAGVFFNTAMHHYMLYKNSFAIWALGLSEQRWTRVANDV